MIIKYDSTTGNILSTIYEAFAKPPGQIGHVQVKEDGVIKYAAGQIRTLIVDGEIAFLYENGKRMRYNFINSQVIFTDNSKEGYIRDGKNNRQWFFRIDKDDIARFRAKSKLL